MDQQFAARRESQRDEGHEKTEAISRGEPPMTAESSSNKGAAMKVKQALKRKKKETDSRRSKRSAN